jgi:hypothetical protein
VNTLRRIPATEGDAVVVMMNDVARVRLRTAQPLYWA